jgi:hypothetical protein
MVKKILFLSLFIIMVLPFVCAENTTLIDSYSYDYVANGTTIYILDQVDSDEMTSITFELDSTPGEYEVSGVLGTTTVEKVFFGDYTNIVTLDFEKVLPGTKKFLLMIYKEDALIAFVTNNELSVDNNVALEVSGDSAIVLNNQIYVDLVVDTSLNISDSKLKIISSKGTVYENIGMTIGNNNQVSYSFAPKEAAEYNLYELDINGYVREINGNIGTYDFAIVKNFAENKTSEGLMISFTSQSNLEKEVIVMNILDEFVYNATVSENSFTIPSSVIVASEINGPYKVIVKADGIDYEFVTQEYTYDMFASEEVVEPVVEEVVIEEVTEKTTSPSGSSQTTSEEETTNETVVEDIVIEEISNESTDVVEEITVEETDINKTEPVVEKESIKDKASNLLTGFSVSDFTDKFQNGKKTLSIIAIAFVLLLVIGFFYVKQRKDAYLYEM